MLATRIDPELLDALDQAASARGVSRSEIVRAALTDVVDAKALDEARMKHLGRVLLEQLERDRLAVQRAVDEHDALLRAGRAHER
jgi:metal-responsive CopG/Arc/MetJ family transcriptional regulator